MKSFKQFMREFRAPLLRGVVVTDDGQSFELLREGKTISGRFERNIRIDRPTHGVGQTHAHVLGRKGDLVGVVNFDGTGSHGTTNVKFHDDDADALRARGFNIPPDNIVEWLALDDQSTMLLG